MGFKNNIKHFCELNTAYVDTLTKFDAVVIATQEKLKAIPFYFRHFSRHDASHSEKIIQYLEILLGEHAICKLSVSDQMMLVLAAYSHDIGMSLEHSQIEDCFSKAGFINDLRNKIPKGYKDLDTIVDEILNFPESVKDYKRSDVLKIYSDVSIAIENVFRSGHAKRSASYIAKDENFITLLGIRGAKLLAKVCELHDGGIEAILDLPYEENGWFKDYLHPRFLAAMLCLGDLLDLDTDRFDEAALKTSSAMPVLSMLHKKKHESIEHYLVRDGKIEIGANCEGYEIYQTLCQWTGWIKIACTFLIERWDEISPDMAILPPRLKKCEILINGNTKWARYFDSKIHIDTAKAVKIFEGGNIYRGKWTFIRELIQNAVDASLIQLCDDAIYIKGTSGNQESLTTEEILSLIKNRQILVDNYDISGRVYVVDNKNRQCVESDEEDERFIEKTVIFELEDHGTGIADSEIDSIIGLKGKSEELRSKIDSYPMFFRPAGVFGLGIQSVFQVASKIEFITKTTDEKSKIITITDPSNSGIVFVEDYNEAMRRGTMVRVTMDLDKFTQTDFGCADYIYQNSSKYQLLLEWLLRRLYNIEKENAPGLEAERQTEDYFNIKICAVLNGQGENREVLVRNSILPEMCEKYTNKSTFTIQYGQLNYKFYDLQNNCFFVADLIAGMGSIDDNALRFGNCHFWRLNNFGNRFFYRNVLAEENLLHDEWETESKTGRYVDFKINIFSDDADKILNVGRNQVKEDYRDQLKKLIDYEFMVMFKNLIDYCITNKIKEKRIIFLAYVESLVYDYQTDKLFKKYKQIINKLRVGNYYDLDGKEIDYPLQQLKGKQIYFLKEIDEKKVGKYPEALWKDKQSCKSIVNNKNFVCLFTIPNKVKFYDRHFLTHYLKGEYYTVIGDRKFIVFEVTPYVKKMVVDAPARADFVKYREFLAVVLGDSRCVLASETYKILETPITAGIVRSFRYGKDRAIEVMLNPIVQKELASVLAKEGYVKDARTYLKKIEETVEYKNNIDFIFKYHKKIGDNLEREVIEQKYQEFVSGLLMLLENRNYATFVRDNQYEIIHNIGGRNYLRFDFSYYDDYVVKRFVEE